MRGRHHLQMKVYSLQRSGLVFTLCIGKRHVLQTTYSHMQSCTHLSFVDGSCFTHEQGCLSSVLAQITCQGDASEHLMRKHKGMFDDQRNVADSACGGGKVQTTVVVIGSPVFAPKAGAELALAPNMAGPEPAGAEAPPKEKLLVPAGHPPRLYSTSCHRTDHIYFCRQQLQTCRFCKSFTSTAGNMYMLSGMCPLASCHQGCMPGLFYMSLVHVCCIAGCTQVYNACTSTDAMPAEWPKHKAMAMTVQMQAHLLH